jgi:hypothetical protein
LETLRLAQRIASDVASREQFRMLRELLERPNRPSGREAAGQLSGEGTLTARVVILADGAVAGVWLVAANRLRNSSNSGAALARSWSKMNATGACSLGRIVAANRETAAASPGLSRSMRNHMTAGTCLAKDHARADFPIPEGPLSMSVPLSDSRS